MTDAELFCSVSNGLNALIRKRDEALRLYHAEAETAHAEMDRADRAEAEVERLRGLLREARLRLDVHGDLPAHPICKRIDAALAEDKP